MTPTEAIASLDLTAIRGDLIRHEGMTAHEADTAIDLYRKFLTVVQLNPTMTVCPTAAADRVWHRHIEQPGYEADCLATVGRKLNHDPRAFGTPAFATAWAETRRQFKALFDIDLVEDATALYASALAPAACYETPPFDTVQPLAA